MKMVSLGDIADFINGAAFKPEDWGEEGARIIRIQNLNDPSKPFNRTKRQVAEKYLVPQGSLLVSWSASLGVFEWSEPDTALLNQHIFKVVPDTKLVHQDYLRLMLSKALKDMEKYAHGSTMLHVNRGEFLATKIPLPPLEEQKRIAAILDQADSLRHARRRAIEKLNTLAQSIFYEMFGEWENTTSRWPIVKLGDKLDFLTSGSRGWAKYYSDSGDKFIRIQNVQRDYFLDQDLAYVKPQDSAEAKRTKVCAGDVLLSITADLGRTAVVPENIGNAYINQHLAILRTKSFNPVFLSSALSSSSGQRNIMKRNREAVKAGLNFDDIRSIEVIEPPRILQDEYEKRINQKLKIEQNLNTHLKHSETLFSSLQHRAFRGEL